jgi:hypothetical protein
VKLGLIIAMAAVMVMVVIDWVGQISCGGDGSD